MSGLTQHRCFDGEISKKKKKKNTFWFKKKKISYCLKILQVQKKKKGNQIFFCQYEERNQGCLTRRLKLPQVRKHLMRKILCSLQETLFQKGR